jgi:phosphatidylserine/phosphatidylglycerophosphate/cardiolipin synthase-like enzyme
VLIDDGDTLEGDEQIAVLSAHPSIDIRIFNPFVYRGHAELFRAVEFAFNASRLDYRMHNKLLVVDNAIALVGGRNIGDQYFQVNPDSQFGDDDVFAAGPFSRPSPRRSTISGTALSRSPSRGSATESTRVRRWTPTAGRWTNIGGS